VIAEFEAAHSSIRRVAILAEIHPRRLAGDAVGHPDLKVREAREGNERRKKDKAKKRKRKKAK
jgi:hypothetical protein